MADAVAGDGAAVGGTAKQSAPEKRATSIDDTLPDGMMSALAALGTRASSSAFRAGVSAVGFDPLAQMAHMNMHIKIHRAAKPPTISGKEGSDLPGSPDCESEIAGSRELLSFARLANYFPAQNLTRTRRTE